MAIQYPDHAPFCNAYADAAIACLESGISQEVYFDLATNQYAISRLAPGTAPTDVEVYVDSLWQQLVGPVQAITTPAAIGYDRSALKAHIIHNLMRQPAAEILSRHLQSLEPI